MSKQIMTKGEKLLIKALEEAIEGLSWIKKKRGKHKHPKHVFSFQGKEFNFTLPMSPSDWRVVNENIKAMKRAIDKLQDSDKDSE